MTEAEWLACDEPAVLVRHLRDSASDRKGRLLTCAATRHLTRHLIGRAAHGRVLKALDVCERFADGGVKRQALSGVRHRADWGSPTAAALNAARDDAWEGAAFLVARPPGHRGDAEDLAFRHSFCALFRDIFGNPFRPAVLPGVYRTSTVMSVARAAYDERQLPSGELDPIRLCVLADALEEVGAPDEVIAHLRSPGPHVRGCWVIDAILRPAARLNPEVHPASPAARHSL